MSNKRKLSNECGGLNTDEAKINDFDVTKPKKLRLSETPSSSSSSSRSFSLFSSQSPSSPQSSVSSSQGNALCRKKRSLGFIESQTSKKLKTQFDSNEFLTAVDINSNIAAIEEDDYTAANNDVEMVDSDFPMVSTTTVEDKTKWIATDQLKHQNSDETSNVSKQSIGTTSTDIVLYCPPTFSSLSDNSRFAYFSPAHLKALENKIMRDAAFTPEVPTNLQIPARMFCWKIGTTNSETAPQLSFVTQNAGGVMQNVDDPTRDFLYTDEDTKFSNEDDEVC